MSDAELERLVKLFNPSFSCKLPDVGHGLAATASYGRFYEMRMEELRQRGQSVVGAAAGRHQTTLPGDFGANEASTTVTTDEAMAAVLEAETAIAKVKQALIAQLVARKNLG